MLTFLLFAGAIHVNLEELGREWLTISSLAIFGTLASTFIAAGVMWLVLGWLSLGVAFLPALLFGALISPTDSIRFGIERLDDRGKFLPEDHLVHLVKELLASSGLAIAFNGRFCEG
jgi:Kef-type K+ transport system membrane component KefB